MVKKLIVFALLMSGFVFAQSSENQRFEGCREKLKKAQKVELLYDMSWDKGRLPRVVVGPTFYSIPFETKQAFAETVNCFLTGGASDCVNFNLLDWRSNNKVARFYACRLSVN